MLEIVRSELNPVYIELYYQWITEEWGIIQSPQDPEIYVPKPLLALDEKKLRQNHQESQ